MGYFNFLERGWAWTFEGVIPSGCKPRSPVVDVHPAIGHERIQNRPV